MATVVARMRALPKSKITLASIVVLHAVSQCAHC